MAGKATILTKAIISILALITRRASDTHSALAIPRTVAEFADGSLWTTVTRQAEPRSVIQVKAHLARFTVQALITFLTLTLPCGLVAVLPIQASNLRAITYIL